MTLLGGMPACLQERAAPPPRSAPTAFGAAQRHLALGGLPAVMQDAEQPSHLPRAANPLGLGPRPASATALRTGSAPGKDRLLTHALGPLLLSLLVEGGEPAGSARIAPPKRACLGGFSSAGNVGWGPQRGAPTEQELGRGGVGEAGAGRLSASSRFWCSHRGLTCCELWKCQTHLRLTTSAKVFLNAERK